MIQDLADGLRILGESNDNALMLESAEALDKLNRRYEIVRKLTPNEFQKLCMKNLYDGIAFDDLIDNLNVKYEPKGKQTNPTWLLPVTGKDELCKDPEDDYGDTLFICMDESLSEYRGNTYVWLFRNGEWDEEPTMFESSIVDTTSVKTIGDISVGQAITTLVEAFSDDPEFAYTWHCNIAMAAFDVIERQTGIKTSHKMSNDIATAVMKQLFNVETTFMKKGFK